MKKLAYYSFRYLYSSITSIKTDIEQRQIKHYDKISILILAAFTYESFLNHAGHFVIQCWDEHLKLRLSPQGKMALLCELAKIEPDYGNSPFQTFRTLMCLRNKLAHAETEYIELPAHLEADSESWPVPGWQILVENLDARRVLDDLDEIILTLETELHLTHVPALLLAEAVLCKE